MCIPKCSVASASLRLLPYCCIIHWHSIGVRAHRTRLLQVEDLTVDQVKSHLQKQRLDARRSAAESSRVRNKRVLEGSIVVRLRSGLGSDVRSTYTITTFGSWIAAL